MVKSFFSDDFPHELPNLKKPFVEELMENFSESFHHILNDKLFIFKLIFFPKAEWVLEYFHSKKE